MAEPRGAALTSQIVQDIMRCHQTLMTRLEVLTAHVEGIGKELGINTTVLRGNGRPGLSEQINLMRHEGERLIKQVERLREDLQLQVERLETEIEHEARQLLLMSEHLDSLRKWRTDLELSLRTKTAAVVTGRFTFWGQVVTGILSVFALCLAAYFGLKK